MSAFNILFPRRNKINNRKLTSAPTEKDHFDGFKKNERIEKRADILYVVKIVTQLFNGIFNG